MFSIIIYFIIIYFIILFLPIALITKNNVTADSQNGLVLYKTARNTLQVVFFTGIQHRVYKKN